MKRITLQNMLLCFLLLGSFFSTFAGKKEVTLSYKNLKNTCYINSLLTLLLNSPLFIQAFTKHVKNEQALVKIGKQFRGVFSESELSEFFDLYAQLYNTKPSSFNGSGIAKSLQKIIKKRKNFKQEPETQSWCDYFWSYKQWLLGSESDYKVPNSPAVCVVRPAVFCKKLIKKMQIEFGEQEDASEALQKVLFVLTDQSELNSAIFRKLFSLLYKQSLTCENCKITRPVADELLTMVPLSLTNSVQESFEKYFSSEKLDAVTCDICCKKTKHVKSKAIKTVPDVLLVVLNRVALLCKKDKNGDSVYAIGKDEKPVKINKELDLQKLCAPNVKQNVRYRLQSFIVHNGSSFNSGHYTAYYKGKNGWVYVNDESVQTDKQACVEAFMKSGTAKNVVSNGKHRGLGESPYVLLYERI